MGSPFTAIKLGPTGLGSFGTGNSGALRLFLGQINRVYNPLHRLDTYKFTYGANIRLRLYGHNFNYNYFQNRIKKHFGTWLGSQEYIGHLKWYKKDKKERAKYLQFDVDLQISNKGILKLLSSIEREKLNTWQTVAATRIDNYFDKYGVKDPLDLCLVDKITIKTKICPTLLKRTTKKGLKLAFESLKEMHENFKGNKLNAFSKAFTFLGEAVLTNNFVFNFLINKISHKEIRGNIRISGEEISMKTYPFIPKFKNLNAKGLLY